MTCDIFAGNPIDSEVENAFKVALHVSMSSSWQRH
jgi:hypothetical protein